MNAYANLFRQTAREFNQDRVPIHGAALAYYTVFAVAPLLLIAVSVAGIFFGKSQAQHAILVQLHSVLGEGSANAVQEMLVSAARPKTGKLATVVGVATLLFGAAGVFGQLQESLDVIWDGSRAKRAGLIGLFRDRFLSLAMVFGVGFLLLVSLVIDTGISALFGAETVVWQVVQVVVSLGVVTVLFAMIFRFLPHIRVGWHDVWLGAGFTSALFVLGKLALGLYLSKTAVASSFGAAGSLVVVLVWTYWSAQILLFGAEFTQVYARSMGSLRESNPVPVAEARVADENERTPMMPPPVIAYRAAPSKKEPSLGLARVAAGGIAGLLLRTLAGVTGSVLLLVKSVRKIIPGSGDARGQRRPPSA